MAEYVIDKFTYGGNTYKFPTRIFNTISEVQSAGNTVSAGDYIKTLGYSSAGDGGGAEYIVKGSGESSSFDTVTLNNGSKIKMIKPEDGLYNVLKLGITYSNCKDKIVSLYDSCPANQNIVLYFPPGQYTMPTSNQLFAKAKVSFKGAGLVTCLKSTTNVDYNCVGTSSVITDLASYGITFSGSAWKKNIRRFNASGSFIQDI